VTLPEGNITLRKVLQRLARALKALRGRREWTQADLAKRARVSPGYIARLETGRHDPKLGTLHKLAKALGVPLTALLR
jgi:transcriptional regulator with XRE-family HTH domain